MAPLMNSASLIVKPLVKPRWKKPSILMLASGLTVNASIFLSSLFFAAPAHADLQQTATDECLLEHLVSSKLDSAARLISRSCEENYKKPNFLSDRRKQYNECLLHHLKGVESEFAVKKILRVCEKKHLRFGSPSR